MEKEQMVVIPDYLYILCSLVGGFLVWILFPIKKQKTSKEALRFLLYLLFYVFILGETYSVAKYGEDLFFFSVEKSNFIIMFSWIVHIIIFLLFSLRIDLRFKRSKIKRIIMVLIYLFGYIAILKAPK